jgi:hypothetical protein
LDATRRPVSSFDNIPVYLLSGDLGTVARDLAFDPVQGCARVGIWLGDATIEEPDAMTLASALIECGACAVSVAGAESERLHDLIDSAAHAASPKCEVVMTAWNVQGQTKDLVFDTLFVVLPTDDVIDEVRSYVFISIGDGLDAAQLKSHIANPVP